MKTSHFLAGFLAAALIIASCSMPQGPSDDIIDQLSANEMVLSVETDTGRNQGVYINEKGEKFDIVSEEGPEGEIVHCVKAVDIVVVGSRSSAKSAFTNCPIKALVLGWRNDCFPGVWEIHHDDSIHAVENEQGFMSSKMAETAEVNWVFHGFFGWEYHVHPKFIGPDEKNGYIVVGYAENKDGFSLGRHSKWAIPAGSKVAVYWRLYRKRLCGFRLSRARIIGEPAREYKHFWNKTKEKFEDRPYRYWLFRLVRFIFGSFRMLFLNYFEIYLKMPDFDQVRYDNDRDVYIVPGVVPGDPVDKPAVAEIDLKGEISIELIDNGGGNNGFYERLVIDTYDPIGAGWEDTYITLYDDSTPPQIIDQADGGNTVNHVEFAYLDYKGGLNAGTYYIEVKHGGGNFDEGYYAIRVLAPAIGEPVGAGATFTEAAVDPYEPDDTVGGDGKPDNPKSISLDTALNRRLSSAADVDWFVLTLQ